MRVADVVRTDAELPPGGVTIDWLESPGGVTIESKDVSLADARRRWAHLLRRIYEVDPLLCPKCGGAMRVVTAAIDGIRSRPGTRIDGGIDMALTELAGPGHRLANAAVMVVVSDGQQTELPASVAVSAERARRQGVMVYAIGLGADVAAAFLTELAGASSRYFFAPEPAQLTAAYLDIAAVIPCDPEDYWGRRCR